MCDVLIQLVSHRVLPLPPDYLVILTLIALLLEKRILAGLNQPLPGTLRIPSDPYPDPDACLPREALRPRHLTNGPFYPSYRLSLYLIFSGCGCHFHFDCKVPSSSLREEVTPLGDVVGGVILGSGFAAS